MSIGTQVVDVVKCDIAAWRAQEVLRDHGGEVYAVGGVVRDVALGVDPHDVDLMVRNLSRDHVRAALSVLPGHVSEIGKSFGILEYRCRDGCVQVALPRKDKFIGSHHRDVDVQVDPTMSVKEDLERRDYTINAVAVKLPDGEVVDPLGGLDDAQNHVVRAVSMEVLADDPLRVVRGVVLLARHPLRMEGQTVDMLRLNADAVKNLPADRVHDEMDKIMTASHPARGIRAAQGLGVLNVILPEVASMYKYDQNSKYHKLDLFDHTMAVLEVMTWLSEDKDLRLAALLHDIGKPSSAWLDTETGYSHFYESRTTVGDETVIKGADHEVVGASMTRDLMGRLRYSTERVNRVAELVTHHMFPYFDSQKGARRFLARVSDHADDLINLRRADDEGRCMGKADVMQSLVKQVREQAHAVSVKSLQVDGHDLIALGVPAGPIRGQILRQLLDEVVEDPSLNDREILLTKIRKYEF